MCSAEATIPLCGLCKHLPVIPPHTSHTHTHTHTHTLSRVDSCESGPGGPTSSSTKRSNSEKGPRVRTVLSEQQLQTLRTVYASNPRPDALLKEHLVEITGLNPRVIRVWFQNKRCKDKKRAIQAEAARLQSLQQQQQQAKVVVYIVAILITPF